MFSWNIAKSAEAMFSRWAIKRVCKFLLKKKLGQFILGDIDLNQLDVQLSAGRIQLSDLALNVDYLNQKFGSAAAVVVKEGSIGSLFVTMPWKGRGCEIEVEELEIVLAPCGGLHHESGSEPCISRQDDDSSISRESGKIENGKMENTMSASGDVHEGVKTIAKMVKWLLTSFHVKVKKLIVAFEFSSVENENGKNTGFLRTLVLRITEVQCGTCISEEVSSNADATGVNLLGLNQLTNFIKFEGAVLEFLLIDGVDNELVLPCASGTTFGEWFSACCPSSSRTPVVTGKKGGFSGTLKLSIPWKNGSLDIRKVDADAYIDPLELRFQISSIRWFLHLWEIVKESGKNSKHCADDKTTESVYFSAASQCYPSTSGSCVNSNGKVMPCNESFSSEFCSPSGKGKVTDSLLPESQLISDWVPFSFSKTQKNVTEEEPDFGASMEQFFDCFDEMRYSQSAMGSSGMWNWTCSVFTAITAASNLASGSMHIPSEQQHVETNLQASVAGITVLFSLLDEDQQHSCNETGDKTHVGSYAHYLGANFRDMLLVLQVCPRQMTFKATVGHVELTDNFINGDDAVGFGPRGHDDIGSQMFMIQQMQAAVQGVLPPLFSSARDACSKQQNESVAADSPSAIHTDGCISRGNCEGIYGDDVVKVTLLKTSGGSQCKLTINSNSLDDHCMGPMCCSAKLPPFVFWVNFRLINLVIDRLKLVGNSFEMDNIIDGSASEDSDSKNYSSSHGQVKRNSRRYLTALTSEERLRGDIFLPTARVVFCFPFENDGDFRSYSSCDQFIALDISSPLTLSEENVLVTASIPNACSQKRFSLRPSCSLHLIMGNLDIYLISPVPGRDVGIQTPAFFAENILSSTNKRGSNSIISMFWQESSVTGPWVAKSAKLLATSEDFRGGNRYVGRGYEFASVTTAKDTENSSDNARQEMILSSALFVHVHLSPVKINLSSSQYKGLHRLLQQAIDGLSCVTQDPGSPDNSAVSQTSIFVECDSLEVSIGLEVVERLKGSIQNELPGSWNVLKLQIKKIQFLSVSNIGGIGGANFLWVAHGEGNLWGSITGVPNEEFLLISCSNSTMGRGDGEGSNVLCSQFSGSDIIHLLDPETCLSYMSITIRCGTIVARGGRLDWMEAISSFFSLPSPQIEQSGDNSLKRENPVESKPCDFSFALNLVDVGLSYEPYLKVVMDVEAFGSDPSSVNVGKGNYGQHFACLLAASSLKLYNSKRADCVDSDHKIIVQDLGLLLCPVPGAENVSGTYSVEHLHKVGYIKVAQEAHFDAILRTTCENGLPWELECLESHIFLDTCQDTTSGLIHLAAQLQQLFAPDLEESVVHLQARWNNVQKAQESDGIGIFNNDSGPSTCQVATSDPNVESKLDVVNLMDEICEDAFHSDGHWDGLSDLSEAELRISVDDGLLEDTCHLSVRNPESSAHDPSVSGCVPVYKLETTQPTLSQKSFPEFIEGYFLTDLRPLSEQSEQKQLDGHHKYKSKNLTKEEVGKINTGWYGDASLKILEDHVSDVSRRTGPQQLVVAETTTSNHNKMDDHGKARGRVLLKNINVVWRMYAGSDWHKLQKDFQHSSKVYGRNRTVCLELALSRMDFQYEIYSEGEICVSRLSLSVEDFHLHDNSQNAQWKLVLGHYQSKDHPRKSSSKAFKLDLEAVRPDPLTPLEEYRLRIALLPMLLHLHQRQLDFLINFFGGKSSSIDHSPNELQELGDPQVFKGNSNLGSHSISEEALLPYFQKFDMWPVLIRVNYVPSRVDLAALSGGKYVELVNLVPWKGVELQLKHVHAVGVYGWSSICETIIGEWLEDISQNQVHKLLRGLPPIRSLVAVGSGAAKLVSLPVKNYRKDHRLLKGMQRGTIAFLRSISLEAVGLGVHLAAGAHDILLQAEYILTSMQPSVPWPVQSRTKTNVRSNQPENVGQGVQQAYESISDGLGKTASALVRTPLKRFQRGAGAGAALATAVQAAPAAAIAPASAAARAMHFALLGVRNSLDPEHKKESIEKYLGATQAWENNTEG